MSASKVAMRKTMPTRRTLLARSGKSLSFAAVKMSLPMPG
jgi:hypothetical protein